MAGASLDSDKLQDFATWCDRLPYVAGNEKVIFASRNPTHVAWEDRQLHNESGPSVTFADGWSHYAISGVAVDEQIVMRPESQTLQQIDGEGNAEVKRIRIERFGWTKFLAQKNAKVIEQRRNDIEQTDEALMQCDGMKILVCACPSTARVYALEVDPECATVEQAQQYLGGGKIRRLVGAT